MNMEKGNYAFPKKSCGTCLGIRTQFRLEKSPKTYFIPPSCTLQNMSQFAALPPIVHYIVFNFVDPHYGRLKFCEISWVWIILAVAAFRSFQKSPKR